MSIVTLLWPAFVLAIALVFIHSIFGLEIIKRGVIFTDLAIGQIASIGMALSIAFMDGAYQTPMTFLFALLGALIITWATRKVPKIEAFIGLLYALGISSIMIILAQSSEGTELFSKLSAADILFSSKESLYKSLMIYTSVALVMFLLYPKLKGLLKEITFFTMLAITVTSSVQSAGVLVVFALLIASYHFDLPTGYTIIFVTVLFSLGFVVVLGSKDKTKPS